MIYLDNNATTAVAPAAVDKLVATLSMYGNPSSKHQMGDQAKRPMMEARAQVGALIGAAPAEIVFTSSGTESNHLGILGAMGSLKGQPEKNHIVTCAVEHPATLALVRNLEAQGLRVTCLPVDADGRLDLNALADALSEDTALVTLMHANNETGVVFPIPAIAELVKSRGILLHVDAVQTVGKLPIDLRKLPVDLLSFSGHKLHAPKGVGVLYVRKGLKLAPSLPGHQERGRRGGTENVPAIAALGMACQLAAESLNDDADSVRRLRDRLETGVLESIPGTRVNGRGAERVANTANLCFPGVEAEAVLDHLDRAGICAAAGAACTSAGTEPSHVLLAMGLSPQDALASIRFSLSRHTTAAEIERTLEVLPPIVRRFLAMAA